MKVRRIKRRFDMVRSQFIELRKAFEMRGWEFGDANEFWRGFESEMKSLDECYREIEARIAALMAA